MSANRHLSYSNIQSQMYNYQRAFLRLSLSSLFEFPFILTAFVFRFPSFRSLFEPSAHLHFSAFPFFATLFLSSLQILILAAFFAVMQQWISVCWKFCTKSVCSLSLRLSPSLSFGPVVRCLLARGKSLSGRIHCIQVSGYETYGCTRAIDPPGFIYVRLSGRMIFSTYGTSLYSDTRRPPGFPAIFYYLVAFAVDCDRKLQVLFSVAGRLESTVN